MDGDGFVDMNGHRVAANQADLFFHASTGGALSDEEWDEQKSRLERDNSHLVPEVFR